MGRPHRICFPGAIFHVTSKGDNDQPIFIDDSDRQDFLQILWKYKREYKFSLHSLTLMLTHIHDVIQVNNEDTISEIMHDINSTYSKRFNWKHSKTGHLFKDRFHAKLIQDDKYFLQATQYDHLNPVKAGIVKNAEDYYWSSYRAYLKMDSCMAPFIDTEKVLSLVSDNKAEQVRLYKNIISTTTMETLGKLKKELGC
ncbi:MAG: transposase [Candidatus Omnitrophota bacterium]|nr:transposase [Candidatus Omnitrophota bacterium]